MAEETTQVPPSVRSASPRTETTRRRSASPRTETKRVRPASPRNKLSGDDNIRSSEISPASSSSNGKVIPNYLRASSGSCHDLCKHGTREELTKEVKERRPWRKSVKAIGPDLRHTKKCKAVQEILATPCEHFDVPDDQTLSHTWTVVSGELFASDGNETTSSATENENQEISVPSDNVTVTVTKKEISSNAKDLNYSKKFNITSKVNPSSRSPSPISKGLSAERSIVGRKNVEGRVSLDGRMAVEGRKHSDQTGRRSLEMRNSPAGEKHICERTNIDLERRQKCDINSSSAENNGEGNETADDKTFPATNESDYGTSLNLETNKKDGGLENIKTDAEPELSLKKHITAPKPKIVKKMKPLPSLYPSAMKPPSPIHPLSCMLGNRRGDTDSQLSDKISTSRVDAKKVATRTPTKSPSSRASVNGAESTITKNVGFIRVVSSSARKVKDTNEQEVPPEKASLTKAKARGSITLLPPVLSVSKSTIRSKPVVGYKSKNTEQETSGRRNGGKPVDAESENHGPSKHKVRKNLLSKETSQNNRPSQRERDVKAHGRDLVKNSINSDRYLLKHPSFSRKKKGGQVLFNKVIEETAKRLVRTRKSNVLALVGAFETVISIQKKSSSAAAAATRPKARKIRSFKKSPR